MQLHNKLQGQYVRRICNNKLRDFTPSLRKSDSTAWFPTRLLINLGSLACRVERAVLVNSVRVHRVNDTVSLSYFYYPVTVLWCSSDVSLGLVNVAGACASIGPNQTWRSRLISGTNSLKTAGLLRLSPLSNEDWGRFCLPRPFTEAVLRLWTALWLLLPILFEPTCLFLKFFVSWCLPTCF